MNPKENFEPVEQVKAPESSPLTAEAQQSFMQRRDSISFAPTNDRDIIRTINHHIHDNIFGSIHDRYDRREEQYYQLKENQIADATEYLQDNFYRLDSDGNGEVDRRELRSASRQAESFDEYDQLQTLQENFDEIKSASRDGVQGITRGDAAVTQRDMDRNREMRGIADRLHRGHPSLFSAIDGNNGFEDGLISRSDLKQFKNEYMHKMIRGDLGGVYTPENMKIVGKMLEQWNRPGSAVNEMKDGEFISRSSLNAALEENRYGDGRNRYPF
ncbi:MAG: hypothetical protein IT343_01650 [Candidatus Melainabacteria bacterium]|nr:hypothetical protein [Candidatus Melainabacteria bacterium]